MPIQRLRIADIQTTELLYYDPDYAEKGYQFCKDRNIDCLPAIGGEGEFYLRNDETKGFDREPMGPERQLAGSTYVFKPSLAERFRQAPVQFVFEREEHTGIIHFSDYNHPAVGTYLYTALSAYERNLRKLAELSKLKNEDMRLYFKKYYDAAPKESDEQRRFNRKLSLYGQLKGSIEASPPFRHFTLEDLIGLVNDRGIIELDPSVADLRNAVMHTREVVVLVDASTPDYIFDLNSFEVFFALAQTLLRDAAQVKNRVAFLGGLQGIGQPP